ncbi:MAG: hypothetical protein JWR59_2465 [Brevundimonas sp.]|nr:hypothetical protein [Brevundimonas sp.]
MAEAGRALDVTCFRIKRCLTSGVLVDNMPLRGLHNKKITIKLAKIFIHKYFLPKKRSPPPRIYRGGEPEIYLALHRSEGRAERAPCKARAAVKKILFFFKRLLPYTTIFLFKL